MKPWRAIQKNRACLQNEPIIGILAHSIKFFHKKKYTVRQRKYCDKLAENFKSVFVCNIIMVGLLYFNFFKTSLFEWPTFSMTYFYVFFERLNGPIYYIYFGTRSIIVCFEKRDNSTESTYKNIAKDSCFC